MLRFYLDLSERQAASAMGISPGAANYSVCRTNPNQSSGATRSRAAWDQGFQIWGSSRPSRPLCNRLYHTARAKAALLSVL
jgi:hypothetical protein